MHHWFSSALVYPINWYLFYAKWLYKPSPIQFQGFTLNIFGNIVLQKYIFGKKISIKCMSWDLTYECQMTNSFVKKKTKFLEAMQNGLMYLMGSVLKMLRNDSYMCQLVTTKNSSAKPEGHWKWRIIQKCGQKCPIFLPKGRNMGHFCPHFGIFCQSGLNAKCSEAYICNS